ncbi:MAG: DUF3881 family protein [Lachnospira sp.]|nr:DUF3881 family protein [Lachnospira sp.]MDD5829280.1 DUF3881 family protein [Lachnospira sp.]
MNIYTRALGFSELDSDSEDKLINAAINENLKKQMLVSNDNLSRAVMVLRISESTGIYIYGRYEDGSFKYEYYFPFVLGKAKNDNDEITIERHLDKESFAVVCDESRTGVTLIFYMQNILDYYNYIYAGAEFKDNPHIAEDFSPEKRTLASKITLKNKKVSLAALSLGGIIMLPTAKKQKPAEKTEEDERNRQRLIQAAKRGDEKAIESLTIEDIDTYTELSQRIMKEDVFSIVDSTFMPCGVECDQYSVIGVIQELYVEKNIYTEEKIYVMVLECNDLVFTMAVNECHLVGEPAVGRRFKGQIWLQGLVEFT